MTSPNTHGTSICIIQPLLKLSNFLAIIPPFNLVKFSKKKRCSKTYKVYTAFVLVIYLSLYGLSVYGRQMVVFSMLAIPIQIVDHVAYATLTLTNTLTSVQSVFFNYEEFRSFFEKTLKVECDVKMRMLSRRSFLKLFVPYVLAVLFLMLVDGFIWMHSLGWVNFRCYILRDIQYVHFCIINFLMFTLARVIEKRFSALNTLLSIVVYSLQNPGFKKEYGFAALIDADSKDFQYQDLKNIGKCYVLLCEMVDTFNKVFGSIIVSVALCTIAILLNNAILAINYSIMSGNDMGGTGFGMNLLILCLMWTFMSMVSRFNLNFVFYRLTLKPNEPDTCGTARVSTHCS